MTNIPQCAVHGTEMKWKEGGVSKAGKPYNGFWSCGQKNADGSWCNYKPKAETPTGKQKFTAELNQDLHDEKIKKAVEHKDDQIAKFNAKNNATIIVASAIQSNQLKLEQTKEAVSKLAKWFYEFNPSQEVAETIEFPEEFPNEY